MAEYIEREAVKSKATYMHGFGKGKYVSVANIDKITAADVVEVKRGRWIEELEIGYDGSCNGTHHRCSVCSEIFYDIDGYNFCPNCGARMEK